MARLSTALGATTSAPSVFFASPRGPGHRPGGMSNDGWIAAEVLRDKQDPDKSMVVTSVHCDKEQMRMKGRRGQW
jgi:hypothetical protein